MPSLVWFLFSRLHFLLPLNWADKDIVFSLNGCCSLPCESCFLISFHYETINHFSELGCCIPYTYQQFGQKDKDPLQPSGDSHHLLSHDTASCLAFISPGFLWQWRGPNTVSAGIQKDTPTTWLPVRVKILSTRNMIGLSRGLLFKICSVDQQYQYHQGVFQKHRTVLLKSLFWFGWAGGWNSAFLTSSQMI